MVDPQARAAGVPTDLALRVIKQESKGNPYAVSPKGAQGIMQLMPATQKIYGVTDPFDTNQNIKAGITHLGKLLKQYGGDQRLALADYNGGPAAVMALKQGHPFAETSQYLTGTQPTVGAGMPPPAPPAASGTTNAQGPVPPTDDPEAFARADMARKSTADPNVTGTGYDESIKQAASKATRLTPEYGPITQIARAVPATIGSFAGNMGRGAAALALENPGAASALAVGSVLAAGGAGLGELGEAGLEKLASMAGLTNVPPPTWEGTKSRVTDAMEAAGIGEGLGRVVGGVAHVIGGPFRNTVDATGQEVRQMFPNALPGQVASSPVLDTITRTAEKAPFTTRAVASRRADIAKQAEQKALDFVAQHGGPITPEKSGDLFKQALGGHVAAFDAEAQRMYGEVDKAGQGVRVPLDSLQEFADQELEKRAGVPGEVSGNRGLKLLKQVSAAGKAPELDPETQQGLQMMAQSVGVPMKDFMADPKFAALRARVGGQEAPMAKDMTFQQAASFRSDLNAFIRRARGEKDEVAVGVAKQLQKRLDTAMDEAGAQSGVKDLYRQANDFYKVGKGKYESDLMRGLMEKNPEQIVDSLVKGGNVTDIRAARTALGDEAWKPVQARVAQNLVEGATEGDGLVGSKLLGNLRGMTPETLKEVFPDTHAQDLWTVGRVLDRAQRASGSGTPMHLYLGQGGLLAGAIGGHVFHYLSSPEVAASTAAVLLTPAAIGKLLTSKGGAKWLSVGLTAKPGTKLAVQAMAKLGAQMLVDRDQGRAEPFDNPVGQPPPGPPPAINAQR